MKSKTPIKALLILKGLLTIRDRQFSIDNIKGKGLIGEYFRFTSRLFKSFIVRKKSIKYYSDEQHKIDDQSIGVGEFILIEDEKYFNFTISNQIECEHQNTFKICCEEINGLNFMNYKLLPSKAKIGKSNGCGGAYRVDTCSYNIVNYAGIFA